jgi:predicted pyridoxine 5'-phosphate oxidase superfamily flavin-nucleotide-binding protein
VPVKIPAEVQEFLKGKEGWVATASSSGDPNVSIKGSLRQLDDEHLLFADLFSLKTRKNLEENPVVAIMVYDPQARRAYMLKGVCDLLSSGSLYDETVENISKRMPQLPKAHYVVKVSVESIYDQSAGPSGGRRIA